MRTMSIKAIVCSLFLLVSISASAGCPSHSFELDPSFNRLSVGGIKCSANYLAEPANGVTLGYMCVYQSRFPFMAQAGVEMSYLASHSKQRISVRRVECHDRFLTACIPVNMGFHFGNHSASIDPYAGFNMRFNLVGKSYADGFRKVDYFDDRDARRFQPGMNIGVDVNLFVLYLGYRYTTDKVNFIPNMKSHNTYHRVTVGFNF